MRLQSLTELAQVIFGILFVKLVWIVMLRPFFYDGRTGEPFDGRVSVRVLMYADQATHGR